MKNIKNKIQKIIIDTIIIIFGLLIYFCHNGVLSIKNKGDLTDSETFIQPL